VYPGAISAEVKLPTAIEIDERLGRVASETDLIRTLTGPKVIALQNHLLAEDDDAGPIDGIFGPRTELALLSFQKRYNLPLTGIPDEGTLDALSIGKMRAPLIEDESATEPGGDAGGEKDRHLFFATTRRLDVHNSKFTERRSAEMSYGKVTVNVPPHKLGLIPRAPKEYRILGVRIGGANPKKHFFIKETKQMDGDEFAQAIGVTGREDALIFVHGFNTNFEDAACRLAQIVSDIHFEGAPILFSWPSKGDNFLDYAYDRESSMFSRQAFCDLLHLLKSRANVPKVHVIAHSMGNQIVVDALANFTVNHHKPLSEVILAAPDVDRDVFELLGSRLKQKTNGGVTLYASSCDKAMRVSRSVARFPRAGDIPIEMGPTIVPNVDTIDVSAMGTDFLRHTTFATRSNVLDDIGRLMSLGDRPPGRRTPTLQRLFHQAKPYWRFP
jgi:esterase/lipase superfamily enzyme